MKIIRLLILIQVFLIHSVGFSQLITDNTITPQNLVQNILMGSGVNASNITFSGNSRAIGSFNGASCNIGLGAGVIITTGTVRNQTSLLGDQQGPFGPNNLPDAGYDNNHGGNSLLESIVNAQTFNAAVLEFDFTAVGSEVSFEYVFASEEYPEYVNAGYNDVFGFFISGPNPGGGSYFNTNIAKVPGTNTVVSIDNVNNLVNSNYYVDNGDGNSFPQNSSPYYVQYDGFTVPLNAHADLVCGATYHIKIAIADVGDGIFDSGVFLQEQSFVSHAALEVATQTTNVVTSLSNNQIYEGCGEVEVILTRSDSLQFNQTYTVSYSGSANASTDFINLPTSVSFSPGQTVQSFTVNGVYDLISEGTENLVINVSYFDACGNPLVDQFTIQVLDEPELNINMPNDTILVCPDGAVQLEPVISGGLEPYTFGWNNGINTLSQSVAPTTPSNYIFTVTDVCGNQTVSDSTFIDIGTYTPPNVDLGNDISVYCPDQPVHLEAVTTDGYGELSYLWSNGANLDTTTVQTLYSNDYWVKIVDQCGSEANDTVRVIVTGSVLQTDTYGSGVYCRGDSIGIGVVASGGAGDYSYLWSTNDTVPDLQIQASSYTYFVEVHDACGTYSIYDTVTVEVEAPVANFTTANEDLVVNTNQYFTNLSTDAVSYYWDLGNGQTSTDVDPFTVYTQDINYEVMLVANDINGCVDTTYRTIIVHPNMIFFVPNSFTPNGDGVNDVFAGKGVGVKVALFQIFDRWGELIFSSTNPNAYWDGTFKGEPAQSDVYVYKIQLSGYDNSDFEKIGHVTLVR